MVFTWHFIHGSGGYPIPYNFSPALFPMAILDEGHTGVALFMTLSGYLFARLLNGRTIDYSAFLWNRALRLLPLLTLIILVVGILTWFRSEALGPYFASVAKGVLLPTLPNGGWSITVEFHYYLLLPLFLWLLRRSRWLPLLIIVGALTLRVLIHQQFGEVQSLAYWTLVGRIDQFALGMLLFQFRANLAGRHLPVAFCLLAFAFFYGEFDQAGGFFHLPSYPSPSSLWIVLPTIEGLAYGIAIAWYDASFTPRNTGLSRLVGLAGAYSYSIYLLHFFFIFDAGRLFHERIFPISNFYLACAASFLCFLPMIVIGHLSFRFIESPFLRLRRPYALALRDKTLGTAVG